MSQLGAEDTADLRVGPPLHDDLLALLPLVGVWRGEGEGVRPEDGQSFRFAQELTFAHDGRPFLTYQARSWLLDQSGAIERPAAREHGFWSPGPRPDDIAAVVAMASGFSVVFGGEVGDLRWELASRGVGAIPTAKPLAGERRLYALVGGGLGYVSEVAVDPADYRPHLNAQLQRVTPTD